MADANDPPVRMIRKRHHLVKEAAWQNPEERELIEGNIAPDDTVEIVKMRKASPLIDRSQNPVVGRMNAPAAAPVDHQAGRSTGTQMDVSPASSVAQVDIPHVHRHEGTTEKVRAYFHAHPHSHAVSHDPDDLNDVVDHDRRDHLSDSRHLAAVRGFGGWESKSAGSSAEDALKAVQADSAKMQRYVTTRGDIPLAMINARLADNAAAIRQLSMSAELGELRKAARPTQVRRAATQAIITKRANPDLAKRLSALDPILALADERIALNRQLDHPDYTIRSGTQELLDQNLAKMEQLHRVNVHKAQVASPGLDAERLGSLVKAAVDQAMKNLDRHIDDLNRRRQ